MVSRRLYLYPVLVFLYLVIPIHHQLYAQLHGLVHYTNDNGLPANGIRGIELDKVTGVLWVGTEGGLTQFNGESFNWPYEDTALAYRPRVYALGKTTGQEVFVQYENEAAKLIDRYGAMQPTFISKDFVFKQPEIEKRYTRALQGLLNSSHPVITETTRFLYLDDRKACLIIYRDSLLLFNKKWTFIPTPAKPVSLLHINGQIILVDDQFHFYYIGKDNRQFKQIPIKEGTVLSKRNPEATLFWETGMDNPILVTGNRVFEITCKSNKIGAEPLLQYPALPPQLAAHIKFIRVWKEKGIIFYGTNDDGLYLAHSFLAQTLMPLNDNGNKYPPVYAFMQFDKDFLQDASGRLYRLPGHGPHAIPRRAKEVFTNAFMAADSSVWLEMSDTIYRYKKRVLSETFGLFDGLEKKLFTETNGKIYIASSTGIGVAENGLYKRIFDFPAWSFIKTGMLINNFTEWEPGVLAICTHRLFLYDIKQGTLKAVELPVSDCMIRSVHKSGEYRFVTTYGKGIFCERNGIVKRIPFDKMGYLSHAHGIIEDRYGFGWISTNHGIFKVRMQSLKDAYDYQLKEIYYHYLGQEEGLVNTELNGGCQPYGLQLQDGTIAFPSMNGIVIVNPDLQCSVASYAPQITGIRIDRKDILPYDTPGSFTWPPAISNLEFRLRIPMWESKENVYVSYMLQGYDKEWRSFNMNDMRTLQFGNITSGSYQLVIRIRSGFGVNDFLYTIYAFTIPLPWYKKWWAIVGEIILVIIVFWGVVILRTRTLELKRKELVKMVALQTEELDEKNKMLANQLQQLNEQNQRLAGNNLVKSRLISIINHDLIAPIKFVGLIGTELQNKHLKDEDIIRSSKSLVTVSNQMEKLASNILTWINVHQSSYNMKPGVFRLTELINEATAIPVKMAKHKNLDFVISVPEDIQLCQYREAMGIILYNLAINAVKYTEKGTVSISATRKHDVVELVVADTGSGITEDILEKLNSGEPDFSYSSKESERKYRFGHFIIRDLLTLTSGKMRIISDTTGEGGTLATLYFPYLTENKPAG